MSSKLPHLTAIVAISVDGKISDATDTPARFSSKADLDHLEAQISLWDAIIFGGNTLRAYGTSLVIKNPQLLSQRLMPANGTYGLSPFASSQCCFKHSRQLLLMAG